MLPFLCARRFVNFLVQNGGNFVLHILSYYRMLNSFSNLYFGHGLN